MGTNPVSTITYASQRKSDPSLRKDLGGPAHREPSLWLPVFHGVTCVKTAPFFVALTMLGLAIIWDPVCDVSFFIPE